MSLLVNSKFQSVPFQDNSSIVLCVTIAESRCPLSVTGRSSSYKFLRMAKPKEDVRGPSLGGNFKSFAVIRGSRLQGSSRALQEAMSCVVQQAQERRSKPPPIPPADTGPKGVPCSEQAAFQQKHGCSMYTSCSAFP